MTQRLHRGFGGERVGSRKTTFKDPEAIDIVGMFPDYAMAHAAWNSTAQRTIDDAHMRCGIAHIHHLRHEDLRPDADAGNGTA